MRFKEALHISLAQKDRKTERHSANRYVQIGKVIHKG
jgi:hypothetical protein